MIIYRDWEEKSKIEVPERASIEDFPVHSEPENSTKFGRFISGFFKSPIEGKEGQEFLRNRLKKSASQKDIENFSVIKRFLPWGAYSHGPHKERIWPDTPLHLILRNEDRYVSDLGFDFRDNSILVSQIQGVRGNQKALKSVYWSQALLDMVTDWAGKQGLEKAYVMPSKRSKWETVKENVSGAYLLYDKTAKKNGFKYNKDLEVYEKSLRE